jgi:ABC-type transport system involved in multi-copper enzyme maturation permease subunit
VIRFAWLQSRTQTLASFALVAALAVAAAITGVQLSHLYSSLVGHCHSDCGLATAQFLTHGHFMDHVLTTVTQIVPVLIGIFWGAPLLSRELETGTFRLAWTQGVTRARWLVTKLALVGLAAVAVAGFVSLTITWWYRVLDPLATNLYAVFDSRDIAPIGYALFAFAAGALIGAIVPRTVPAMATTIGVFAIARVAVTLWVRPHLMHPTHEYVSLSAGHEFGFRTTPTSSTLTLNSQASGPTNSWTLSTHVVTSSGRAASSGQVASFVHQHCPGMGPSSGAAVVKTCLSQAGRFFRILVTYQPVSHYWTLQWLETGVFLGLSFLAFAGCYWWVTRRVV